MEDVKYLALADVLAIYTEIMESLGFRPEPLRDAGLLEAALMRPQMAAYYEEADLIRQAALLAVGIAPNQPFVDGNKRAAYAACFVFLRQNGYRFTGQPMALARQLELVAERTDSLHAATARFEDWLRANTAK